MKWWILLFWSPLVDSLAEDWIDYEPETVYTRSPIDNQNLAYDLRNNMFRAQSAWMEGKEVHYYRFRLYDNQEYENLSDDVSQISFNKYYILTRTGTFDGAVGMGILAHHSVEVPGTNYSDFARIYLVLVSDDYEADYYRSEGDLLSEGAPIQETRMYVNMPIVPRDSKLQDPTQSGTLRAPIDPLFVWYRGVRIWTYTFEVSDARAAEYFRNRTRTTELYPPAVTPFVTEEGTLQFNRLFHLNQFEYEVTSENTGNGPLTTGMRNLVEYHHTSRTSYTPLLRTVWVTQVPVNFGADQVRSTGDLIRRNGFLSESLNEWFNCPTVGFTREDQRDVTPFFLPVITTEDAESVVQGSPLSLRFQREEILTIQTVDRTELSTAATNLLGAYRFRIDTTRIPPGAVSVNVHHGQDIIRELPTKDYITIVPPTIWEQNTTDETRDFDSSNNMFVAHSVWYKDTETHFYKFRHYNAETYPGLIGPQGANVPVQKMYLVGENVPNIIGAPIIQHVYQAGNLYSDFYELIYVIPPPNYLTDDIRSEGDIINAGLTTISSGIIVNAPLVPVGARLQDAARAGARFASVEPLIVWYKGVEVWTYVFETTDMVASDYFAAITRPVADPLYRITTTEFWTREDGVASAPMYFLNQYRKGVTSENYGGPDREGMRNVVDVDRPDPGYSPLRKWFWVSQTPLDLSADAVSNKNQLSGSNGFQVVETNFFSNCPLAGQVRQQTNAAKQQSFATAIDVSKPVVHVQGADPRYVLEESIDASLRTIAGSTIVSTTSNWLGGFDLRVDTFSIPDTTGSKVVVAVNKRVLQEIEMEGSRALSSSGVLLSCLPLVTGLGCLV